MPTFHDNLAVVSPVTMTRAKARRSQYISPADLEHINFLEGISVFRASVIPLVSTSVRMFAPFLSRLM